MSSNNKKALIGYTGFVGGNINSQADFTDRYNTQNVADIEGQSFDLVVSAGAKAVVWQANKDPEGDWAGIQDLINHLEKVEAKKFVLISTVDVYVDRVGVDESTMIDPEKNLAYGKNRYKLEEFVRGKFADVTIVRLPGLFGEGLKKNLIFDMIHDNNIEAFHADSTFQFYNLDNVWKDIQTAMDNDLDIINFAVEPTSVREVFKGALDQDFENDNGKDPVVYDMHTIHADDYGKSGDYLYNKEQVLAEIKQFVQKELKNK